MAQKPTALPAISGGDLNDPRIAALAQLLRGLVTDIRFNRNARTMVSLRGSPGTGVRLSLHLELINHPPALAELPAWISSNGRGLGPVLKAAIDVIFSGLAAKKRANPGTVPVFAAPASALDLETLYAEIHQEWFPHLTRPPISWGPRLRVGPRRHIRFASYHRRPQGRIIVSRLLGQAWVAREFVAFVLYHELCHHAQASAPVRGETPHSARFKAWEARFPRFTEILAWEKAHLDRFLGTPSATDSEKVSDP